MQIPVQQLPILQPEQMSPFHQALQTALQTYGGITKAAYEPMKTQADISSKMAYSSLALPGFAAKQINNPDWVNTHSKEDYERMKYYADHPESAPGGYFNTWGYRGPVSGMPAAPTQPAPQPVSRPAPAQDAGSEDTTDYKADSSRPPVQRAEENVGMEYNADGTNVRATPSQVAQTAYKPPQDQNYDDNNPTGSTAVNNQEAAPVPENISIVKNPGGLRNNISPTSPLANRDHTDYGPKVNAQLAADPKTQSPEYAQQLKFNQNKQDSNDKAWAEINKGDINAANSANETLSSLDAVKNAYKELPAWQKGVILGSIPFGGAAALVDQYAENTAAANTRALQQGHITEGNFQMGQRLKPHRGLNPKEFDKSVQFNEALKMRALQKQAFNAEAQNRGFSPENADKVWNAYIQNHPPFDEKAGIKLTDNLGYGWRKYFDPKILKKIENGTLNSPKKSAGSKPEKKEVIIHHEGKSYKLINNKWYPV